ncbi:uncharacterized protein LOC121777130 [Salvia splendens]|uniref:uncharacterized protein LOC121777130 n=1 Tax=Salvia splendens TaxID=180675 RepID=UPI001C26F05E|nr:uncharacterized protein LOC121777130 [Salvia splendens]
MEVKHQVVHGLDTMPPEKDQEERGQVDELLAQGSGVQNPDLRANHFQEGYMTTGVRRQEFSLLREPRIDWGSRMRKKTCQGSNEAKGPLEDARNREGSDLRTNPFQEGDDDTIMEGVHQSLQLQPASISIFAINIVSLCPCNALI